MKYVIDWIKGNTLTVISLVVVVLALGLLGWIWMQERSFEERLAAREQVINRIDSYMRRSVDIPPEQPDDPAETIPDVTINPAANEAVAHLYEQMGREYEGIFNMAVQINKTGHELLAEGLFPAPNDPALPIQAQVRYRDAFEAMLRPATQEPTVLPRLNAGEPVTKERVEREMAQVEADYRGGNSQGGGAASVSDEEQQRMVRDKRARFADLLRERAESIHLYAATNPSSQEFPFNAQALPQDASPELFQLWEGQLELWIQQDIAQAIAQANNTQDPSSSVLDAPVKRLISVSVLPGYVGLHNTGGITIKEEGRTSSTSPGYAQNVGGVSEYPPPAGGMTGSPDERVSDNFYVGPSGRVSNGLYDVRHARLVIMADVQRLPELFEQISRVNFMTILETRIVDVDEYEELQNNYFYGAGDIAQVELLIETIWLRDWTAKLMPSQVRQYVGIDPAGSADDQQGGPGVPRGPSVPNIDEMFN